MNHSFLTHYIIHDFMPLDDTVTNANLKYAFHEFIDSVFKLIHISI